MKKSLRNEIKHMMRAVTLLATIFTMTFVLAGSANAVVIGPADNSTVLQAPIGTASIVNPLVAAQAIVRPPVFNPFFMPVFNPFFRPPIFNPFFRPLIFTPFFNPFFGVDLDDLGVGLGAGIGAAAE